MLLTFLLILFAGAAYYLSEWQRKRGHRKYVAGLVGLPVEGVGSLSVVGPSEADLKQVLADFEKLYNVDVLQIHLVVETSPDGGHLISCPQGIHFDHLCYLVNYCDFPMHNEWPSGQRLSAQDVTGWTRVDNDTSPGPFPIGTELMLYVDPADPEADNVYIAAAGWPTYRYSFGGHHPWSLVESSHRSFVASSR